MQHTCTKGPTQTSYKRLAISRIKWANKNVMLVYFHTSFFLKILCFWVTMILFQYWYFIEKTIKVCFHVSLEH